MTSKTLSFAATVLALFGSVAAHAAIKVQCTGMVQDLNYCLDDMCSYKSSVVLKEFDRSYPMNFAFSGEAIPKLKTRDYDYQSRYEFTLYKGNDSASPQLEVRVKNGGETRFFIDAKAGQKLHIRDKFPVDSDNSPSHVLKCELSE